MLLEKDRTHTSDCIQQERIDYHLQEVISHLENLCNSLKEVQIDLFHVVRHVKDLEEAFYATK